MQKPCTVCNLKDLSFQNLWPVLKSEDTLKPCCEAKLRALSAAMDEEQRTREIMTKGRHTGVTLIPIFQKMQNYPRTPEFEEKNREIDKYNEQINEYSVFF